MAYTITNSIQTLTYSRVTRPRTQEAESLPVLREEVEEAVPRLKAGKSPGVDNIPSELLKNGGDATTTVLTALCQKIRETKEWPNYRTISLISHPSKIMLQVILIRLKAKAEELLVEEQAGYRPGRGTVEQIFNSRVVIEKHLQHQRALFHNFIDFE